MKLAPSEPLIRLLYLSGLSRNGRTPTQTKPLLFHLKWKSILKRQILVLGFWCISNCCNACNSLLVFCVPRERLCIWIPVSSAHLLPGGHVRIYSCLYFRAMNTRLIRLLYVEVCFHFLFSGRDWTRVILVDLGVVSSNPNRSGTKGGHTQGLDATVSRLSSFPRYPDTLITRCYDTRSPPPPSKCVKIIVKVHGCLTRWWLKPFITFFISYFILLF